MVSHYSFDPTRTAFEYLRQGKVVKAEHRFREILNKDPFQADALHGMACLARLQGQNATAIALAGKALKNSTHLSPSRLARIHLTLGAALLSEGHTEPARASLSVATLLQPSDHRAYAALAQAFLILSKREDAKNALEQAISLAAQDQEYLTQLGQIYLEDGDWEQSIACFNIVTKKMSKNGAAWANLGAALFSANSFQKAKDALLRAKQLGSQTAETLNNLGLVQMALGELPAARQSLVEALELKPNDARIANSLGTVLMELEEEDKALRLFSEIVTRTCGYEANQARFNMATILLGRGEFLEGWKHFESRHALLNYKPGLPIWDGREGGDPVLVTAEQGLGDTVQFLRFLKEAVKRRPIEVDFSAASLINYMPDIDKSRVKIGNSGHASSEISLLSLPYVLGIKEPPEITPYLTAESQQEENLIGLCWAGNETYRFDCRRSIPLELLHILKDVPGVRFLSLQKGETPFWMESAGSLNTIDDLAHAVARCSLVISVDTLVAHMAGAIGRPLWLLNRLGGDWRWKNISWYQNVRQFRPMDFQAPRESWRPVLEQVKYQLTKWVKESR